MRIHVDVLITNDTEEIIEHCHHVITEREIEQYMRAQYDKYLRAHDRVKAVNITEVYP